MDRIWCFWANPHNMTYNRKNSLNMLRSYNKLKVELVNSKSIYDFEIQNNKIHEAFKYLSDTHKADYARCYLTHHYGGAYADIKPFKKQWSNYFYILNNPNIDLIGSAETSPSGVAHKESANLFQSLVSPGGFIMKQYSKISKEWMDEIHLILDSKLENLKSNPGWYHPRAVVKSTNSTGVFDPEDARVYEQNYPLDWAEICGCVFHKVQSNNLDRISNVLPPEYFSPAQYR